MIEEILTTYPGLIEFPELSREYRERIDALPESLTSSELLQMRCRLKLSPLVSAAAVLYEPLADKQGSVHQSVRSKASNLLGGYSVSLPISTQLALTTSLDKTRATILHPSTGNPKSLQNLLLQGGACTTNLETAENHFCDTSCGGSIHFQVQGTSERSYNRLFVCVDKEGKPFLFYDTIEANNWSRSKISEYVKGKIADVLIGSVAASLVIAEKMGVEYIAFGDYELVELMQDLGYGERSCFNGNGIRNRPKLGIKLEGGVGKSPHFWKIDGSSNFRTIQTAAYASSALDTLVEQADAVIERLRGHKKKAREAVLAKSQADFESYFAIVEEALGYAEILGISCTTAEDLKPRLAAAYREYGLTPILPVLQPRVEDVVQPLSSPESLAKEELADYFIDLLKKMKNNGYNRGYNSEISLNPEIYPVIHTIITFPDKYISEKKWSFDDNFAA